MNPRTSPRGIPEATRHQMLDWPLNRKRHESEKCLQPAAHNLRISFLSINKNGTTTAQVAIRKFHKLAAVNWLQHPVQYPDHKIVSMWRDPYHRCESTYRWATESYGEPVPGVMPCPRTQSFASWVEELCDVDTTNDWYDMHLQSQVYLASSPDGALADIILPWDWSRLWMMFRVPPGEHRNKSTYVPTEWTPRAREAFERVYACDIEVWIAIHKGK